jgi:hypothetical protein
MSFKQCYHVKQFNPNNKKYELDSDLEEEEEEEEEEQKLDARSQSKLINLLENGRMRSFKAVPSENVIINDAANNFNAADSKIAINIVQNIENNPNVMIKINLNKRKFTESINISIE